MSGGFYWSICANILPKSPVRNFGEEVVDRWTGNCDYRICVQRNMYCGECCNVILVRRAQLAIDILYNARGGGWS